MDTDQDQTNELGSEEELIDIRQILHDTTTVSLEILKLIEVHKREMADLKADAARMQEQINTHGKTLDEMANLKANAARMQEQINTHEKTLNEIRRNSQCWNVGFVPSGYLSVRSSARLSDMLFS